MCCHRAVVGIVVRIIITSPYQLGRIFLDVTRINLDIRIQREISCIDVYSYKSSYFGI